MCIYIYNLSPKPYVCMNSVYIHTYIHTYIHIYIYMCFTGHTCAVAMVHSYHLFWVLPPFCTSWLISTIYIDMALNMTPNQTYLQELLLTSARLPDLHAQPIVTQRSRAIFKIQNGPCRVSVQVPELFQNSLIPPNLPF